MTLIEKITHNGLDYAIIIRGGVKVDGAKYFTNSDSPLQLGVQQHKKGYSEPAHFHKIMRRNIDQVHQVSYYIEGKAKYEFFDTSNNVFYSTIINGGDTILVTENSHKMTILEDINTITIKQGPYLGMGDDQVLIEEKT